MDLHTAATTGFVARRLLPTSCVTHVVEGTDERLHDLHWPLYDMMKCCNTAEQLRGPTSGSHNHSHARTCSWRVACRLCSASAAFSL